MVIEIPKNYMGEPIKGAMDKILKGDSQTKKTKGKNSKKVSPNFVPSPSNLTDADKYIILPEAQHGSYSYPEMLVSMDKKHFNKDWNKAHELLAKEDVYMLTIRQFADFLSLLKSGKAFDGNGKKLDNGKLEAVLNDIIEVREPWRSEWLDAKFEDGNIIYHTLERKSGSYTLVETKEPLANYIKKDKVPGINLDDWLKKANNHGLPTSKTNKGYMHYWAPTEGTVAGFVADSDWAGLDCGWDPAVTNSSLGVRAVRAKI